MKSSKARQAAPQSEKREWQIWTTYAKRWVYVFLVGSLFSTIFLSPSGHVIGMAGDIFLRPSNDVRINSAKTLERLAVGLSMPCYFEIPGNPCLDTDAGVRLIVDHVQHVMNVLTIVEGLGRPLGKFFIDSIAERTDRFFEIYRFIPREEKAFLKDVIKLLRKLPDVGMPLRNITDIPTHITYSGESGRQLRHIIRTLTSMQSRHDSLNDNQSSFHRKRSMAEIDHVINPLMRDLFSKLSIYYQAVVIPYIDDSLLVAENVSFHAVQMPDELEREFARVNDTISNVSWWDQWAAGLWDRWAPADFQSFGPIAPTWRLMSYQQALKANEYDIRRTAEEVLIVRDNLRLLKDYVLWHKQHMSEAMKFPWRALAARNDTPSVSQTMRIFDERIDGFRKAGLSIHPEFPARPPRRIPPTIFSVVKKVI